MVESIKNIGSSTLVAVSEKNTAKNVIFKKEKSTDSEKTTKKSDSTLESNKVEFGALQEELSTILENSDFSMEFSIDEETNKRVLKFIDVETEEIVRQFPPEVSLKVARLVTKYKDQGLIVNVKV